MTSQRDLVQRLTRRDPGAWSVVERARDLAIVDDRVTRRERRVELTVIVHADTPRGRGSARIDVAATDASADDLVDQAIALAATSVGPAWLSAPPAAPAKVAVLDDDLATRPLDTAAEAMLAHLRRPAGVELDATLTIARDQTTVVASSGFHTSWLASHLRADLALTSGGRRIPLVRQARRAIDLDLDGAVALAAADLAQLAGASDLAPGPCAVWLGPDALLPDDDHGLWSIFATQADATFERQGLTRYRLHAELAPGAAQLAAPLTITSDGALDFALRSAPVTDDAVAIRRFPLVERGRSAGLGLSPREAALRHTDPNGGVRNLIVSPGAWSPPSSPSPPFADLLPARTDPAIPPRILELRRLSAFTIDRYTGDATLDIALALDHRPDRAPTPFTGGTIRLDLITALARAHRSTQLLRRAAYHGPASVLIADALLLP